MTGLEVADVNIKVAGVEMEGRRIEFVSFYCLAYGHDKEPVQASFYIRMTVKNKRRKELLWSDQNSENIYLKCFFRWSLIPWKICRSISGSILSSLPMQKSSDLVYIQEKYQKIVDKLPEIDDLLNENDNRLENWPHEQS